MHAIPHSPAADLQWWNELETHHVDVGGAPMAYRDVGEGPTLLFIHGWPMSGSTWRSVVRPLSTSFRCVVLDLPGAGNSPLHWHADEFFDHVGVCVDRFAAALALKDYGVIGYDSGAAGARLHAARSKEVRALFMSNTEIPDHAPTVVLRIQKMAALPFAAPIFAKALDFDVYLKSNYGFGSSVAHRSHIDATFREANVENLQRNVRAAMEQVLRADLVGIGNRLHRDVHPKLTMPTAFLWGLRDRFFPLENARKALAAMPGGQEIFTVEDSALLVHEEQPAIYAQHMQRFFDAHLAASADQATPLREIA